MDKISFNDLEQYELDTEDEFHMWVMEELSSVDETLEPLTIGGNMKIVAGDFVILKYPAKARRGHRSILDLVIMDDELYEVLKTHTEGGVDYLELEGLGGLKLQADVFAKVLKKE